MRKWRLSDRPIKPDEDDDMRDPEVRANVKATIFFSYTSNMVSCGVRETIRFLAQHKMVDAIVTSAGGIGGSRCNEAMREGGGGVVLAFLVDYG